jgi:hypothetical protein
MRIHILRGIGRVFGFTRDEVGANLPAQYGPWIAFKSSDLNRGDVETNFDVNECLDDIETFGFHLTEAHVRITDKATTGHSTR